MIEVIRADAARIDELEPLWLALRAHHGSVTGHWGALRPPEDSWRRRRATYVAILEEGGSLHRAVPNESARRFYEKHGYRVDLVTFPEAGQAARGVLTWGRAARGVPARGVSAGAPSLDFAAGRWVGVGT